MKQNAAACTVVVAFGADDAMASWTLPVVQAKTIGDKSYWMPDLDEQVVCLMDERAEFGVVLGGIYSAADHPPIANLDAFHVRFKDGTTVEFDRSASSLAIAIAAGGSIAVSADDVTITVAGSGSLRLGGSGGDELATKAFITERFDVHVHPSLGSPPTPTAMLPGWTTSKTVAE